MVQLPSVAGRQTGLRRVGFWFDSKRTVNKKLANVSWFLSFRVPGFASADNRSFSEAQVVVVLCQLLPLSSSLSVSNKSMTSPAEILSSQTTQDLNIAQNCLHAMENAAFSNNRKFLLLIERQESRVVELVIYVKTTRS